MKFKINKNKENNLGGECKFALKSQILTIIFGSVLISFDLNQGEFIKNLFENRLS